MIMMPYNWRRLPLAVAAAHTACRLLAPHRSLQSWDRFDLNRSTSTPIEFITGKSPWDSSTSVTSLRHQPTLPRKTQVYIDWNRISGPHTLGKGVVPVTRR
jgi:hypothetical protein